MRRPRKDVSIGASASKSASGLTMLKSSPHDQHFVRFVRCFCTERVERTCGDCVPSTTSTTRCCCSFGRKSSFQAAQRCSVRTRTTTTGHDSFVLKTSQRTVRTSTSQRSHLLSCEHSWAEQTTGSRTMRLRERMHTNREKTAQKQTTRTFGTNT